MAVDTMTHNPAIETVPVVRAKRESQLGLMWRRFKRHRLALVSLWIVALFYLIALLAEFLAPADPSAYSARYTFAPPQGLQFFSQNDDGSWRFFPHVNGYKSEIDRAAMRRTYVIDPEVEVPVQFVGEVVDGAAVVRFDGAQVQHGLVQGDRGAGGELRHQAPVGLHIVSGVQRHRSAGLEGEGVVGVVPAVPGEEVADAFVGSRVVGVEADRGSPGQVHSGAQSPACGAARAAGTGQGFSCGHRRPPPSAGPAVCGPGRCGPSGGARRRTSGG